MATDPDLEQLAINTIRTLSMDAVQQANSGHPGTPMALAPVAYCLWQKFLRFDPEGKDVHPAVLRSGLRLLAAFKEYRERDHEGPAL